MPIFNCRWKAIFSLIIILVAFRTNVFSIRTSKAYSSIVKRSGIIERIKKNVCDMESFPPKFETFSKEGSQWKVAKQSAVARKSKK